MKIYTKHGDDGSTSLYSGDRIFKTDSRVEAYGEVDELNAFLGLWLTETKSTSLTPILSRIQNELFDLGADLATPLESSVNISRVEEHKITALEKEIDAFEEHLPPLKQFILPGGSKAAALAHVCRTKCRSAERRVVQAAQSENINALVIKYLNRLSDFLFVAARFENREQNITDSTWTATPSK